MVFPWWKDAIARHRRGLTPGKRGCALLLVSAALMGVVQLVAYRADMRWRLAQTRKSELIEEASRVDHIAAEQAAVSDFTKGLSQATVGRSVTAQIQAAAAAASASLVALVSIEHAESAKALEHAEWAVTLRGTYPHIKTLLAQLLDATHDLRIHALRIKRQNANEVEAQVSIVQWLRPRGTARAEVKD